MSENVTHKLEAKIVLCIECDAPFVITPSERKFYLDRLLSEPKRCPDCRARRRALQLPKRLV